MDLKYGLQVKKRSCKSGERNIESNKQDSNKREVLNSRQLEMDIAGSSTPIIDKGISGLSSVTDTSVLFMSPLRRLDELHLGGAKKTDSGDKASSQGSCEGDDENAMVESTEIEHNFNRKRRLESSSDVEMGTPCTSIEFELEKSRSISIMASNSSLDNSKSTYSNLECTPCPVQPRKKFKGKENTSNSTPTQKMKKKKLLNFKNSIKASINSLPNVAIISKEDSTSVTEHEESYDNSNEEQVNFHSMLLGNQLLTLDTSIRSEVDILKTPKLVDNIPISMSTPTNSKPSSPKHKEAKSIEVEEYGPRIEGYRLLRKKRSEDFLTYMTPENKLLASHEMKLAYNINDFSLNDQHPLEGYTKVEESNSEDEDSIANRRLNDPYIMADETSLPSHVGLMSESSKVRTEYFESFRSKEFHVPLLRFYEHELSFNDIISLVNDGVSVLDFFQYIKEEEESLFDLLKQERTRWHPDKWVNKIKDEADGQSSKQIIDNISKVLNSIVENYA